MTGCELVEVETVITVVDVDEVGGTEVSFVVVWPPEVSVVFEVDPGMETVLDDVVTIVVFDSEVDVVKDPVVVTVTCVVETEVVGET